MSIMAGITKNEEKLIRSLSRKKERDVQGLFIVEGEKMVAEALASSLQVVKVFRSSEIGEEAMKRITLLTNPSPALAVVRRPHAPSLPSGRTDMEGISLALDAVRDPGNLGTILRICDWFGVSRIYASDDTVDVYNPKTVQASMGAVLRRRVTYTDLEDLIDRYDAAGIPVYGTFLDGSDIHEAVLDRSDALIVMGSESSGISRAAASKIRNRLLIPPFPEDSRSSESLNVAVATAILCYEFRRK